MSWLSDLFSGGKNPADAAMPYLNQIPGVEKQYYEPYIGYGKEAYNTFSPQLKEEATHPVDVLEGLLKRYEPSKAYQLARDEALRAAGNTAAAGGIRGSLSDIKNEARLSDALLGEDMQRWLQNVRGIQSEGLGGLQLPFETGFKASSGLASDLGNVLGTQAQLAFQGQANQNLSRSDLLSGLVKALGTLGGWALPSGGTIGGSLFSKFI